MPLTQAEADKLKAAIDAMVVKPVAAAAPPAPPPAVPAPQLKDINTASWRLAFNEDWSKGLDFTRWSPVLAQNDRHGSGSSEAANSELEWYINDRYAPTAAVKPWRIDGTDLVITADHTPADLVPLLGYNQADLKNLGAYPYTSGLIHTRDCFRQLYGYFEAEMVLPAGRGLWPAFWLLPQSMAWPPEIDIVEMLGHEPNRIYTTVHAPDQTNAHIEAWVDTTAKHRYGALWKPGSVSLFIDGQPAGGGIVPTTQGVETPMYILLNLAVGGPGSWPGPPDATTHFPAEMRVGPVRAWAL